MRWIVTRNGTGIVGGLPSAAARPPSAARALQKAYASLSKDLRTKIFPNLDHGPRGMLTGGGITSARKYWNGIDRAIDDFAKGRIDPIGATQKMRLLTGGTTMQQVADKARALMAQLGR